MKNFTLSAGLLSMVTLLTGCDLVTGIFKAGMWTTVIIIVVVIALVLFIIRKVSGGNNS